MVITKETELIIMLMQLPGFGSKISEIMANFMIENRLLDNIDIYSVIRDCVKNKLINPRKEISYIDIQNAIDKSKEIIERSLKSDIMIVSKFDEDYPFMLRSIVGYKGESVSPVILNFKGNISLLKEKKSIAIIGTRHPTIEGENAGMYYAKYFAEKGFNIVSGLALGCDAIAHKGALSVNGKTTAVLAHGLHMVSPKSNEYIAKEILDKDGLLLSEYLIGTPAFTTSFVERDRLQAGLAIATIVIQTGIKGGTMHAVRAAINNEKVLAAVSYKEQSVRENDNVVGNNHLIEQGAFPLRKAEDFYDFIRLDKSLQYKTNELKLF